MTMQDFIYLFGILAVIYCVSLGVAVTLDASLSRAFLPACAGIWRSLNRIYGVPKRRGLISIEQPAHLKERHRAGGEAGG